MYKKARGKPHSLLLGQFILQYIPVHLFKETEVRVPLISPGDQSCSLLPVPKQLWVPVGVGSVHELDGRLCLLNVFWVIPGEVSWERAAPHVSSYSALRDSLLTGRFGISLYYSHRVFEINTEFVSPRWMSKNFICDSGFRAVCQSKEIWSPSSGGSSGRGTHPLTLLPSADCFDPRWLCRSWFFQQPKVVVINMWE